MRDVTRIIIFSIIAFTLTLLVLSLVDAHAGGAMIYFDAEQGGAQACTWKVAWSATTVASQPIWNDYNGNIANRRTIINSGDISYYGDTIRLVFQGHSSYAATVHGVSIGVRSGTSEDYNATPTRVTCSSGNECVVAAGTETTTDEIAFSLSSSTTYLVHVYTNGSPNNYEAYLTQSGAGYEQLTSTDYTMTQDVTMSSYGYISHLSLIEVCTTE